MHCRLPYVPLCHPVPVLYLEYLVELTQLRPGEQRREALELAEESRDGTGLPVGVPRSNRQRGPVSAPSVHTGRPVLRAGSVRLLQRARGLLLSRHKRLL